MLSTPNLDPIRRRWVDLCWVQTAVSRREQAYIRRSDPAAGQLVRAYCLLPHHHTGRHLGGSLDPQRYPPGELGTWLTWRGESRQIMVAAVCAARSVLSGRGLDEQDRCRLPAGHRNIHSHRYVPDVVWRNKPTTLEFVLDAGYSHGRLAAGPDERPSASFDEWTAPAASGRYDWEDRLTGMLSMLEQHVRMPFQSRILGVPVTVDRLELARSAQIVAVVHRRQHEQRIGSGPPAAGPQS